MNDFELWSNHQACRDGNNNPKKTYFSEQEAKNTAEYIEHTREVKLRVYQCQNCGYYHLTKNLYPY